MSALKVCAAGALALLLSVFGSASEFNALSNEPTSGGTVSLNSAKQPEDLTLLALNLHREPNPNRPGWDSVTVELGVRNDSARPQYVSTVAGSSGIFEVAEGDATYDTEIEQGGYADWILLPPGFVICGELAESRGEVTRPTAATDIPSSLHPVKLRFGGFPAIDLTKKVSSKACTPTPKYNAPLAPTDVRLADPGESVTGTVRIDGYQPFPEASFDGQTRVNAQVTNSNRFEDFELTELRLWLVDKDGVVRFAYELAGDDWVGKNCEINIPGTVTVPPSSTVNARACYPYRPGGNPFAVIIQYESSDPSVVRLRAP